MNSEETIDFGLKTGKHDVAEIEANEAAMNIKKEQLRLLTISVFSLDQMNDDCAEAYADAIIAMDALTFTDSPRVVLSNINEIVGNIVSATKSTNQAEPTDREKEFGELLGYKELSTIKSTKGNAALQFLLIAAAKCSSEKRKGTSSEDEKIVLEIAEKAIYSNLVSLLRGQFEPLISGHEVRLAFVRRSFDETISELTLKGIVECASNPERRDPEALTEAFNPILDILRISANVQNFERVDADSAVRALFELLIKLLSVKIGSKRPICDLVVNRSDFYYNSVSETHRGRELAHLSYLGPFLNYGLHVDETKPMVKAFQGCEDDQSKDSIVLEMKNFHSRINESRGSMHKVFHQLLVNPTSRAPTLKWIADVVSLNAKKVSYQTNHAALANNTFLVNLLAVLYRLSAKIDIEKVNTLYPFKLNSLLKISEKTRIKMDLKAAREFSEKIDNNAEEKFTTECFFLTLECQALVIEPLKTMIMKMSRHIKDLKDKMDRIRKEIDTPGGGDKTRLKGELAETERLFKTYSQVKMYTKCLVDDQYLISDAADFADKQLNMLIQAIDPNNTISGTWKIPDEIPEAFAAYPEHYLEDVLFIFTTAIYDHQEVLRGRINNWPTKIGFLFINNKCFNNPFLIAKLVKLMAHTVPQPGVENPLWNALITFPLAIEQLIPTLIKFYSDFEDSGDFYEKFQVRREIQAMFERLDQAYLYKGQFNELARKCGQEFIRFINMVVNDATWCIDESLSGLKHIHEVELAMDKVDEWNSLSQEQRDLSRSGYDEAKTKVRGWLGCGIDAFNMLVFITNISTDPFKTSILGERLAAMMNHNLIQLCGNKCQELKVKDPVRRYRWDPRKLVGLLVQIYVNLHNEEFVKYIAYDERSYHPDVMADVVVRMRQRNIIPSNQLEQFVIITEDAKREFNAKAAMEDLLEDVPEEFKDPIMDAIMSDPVKLPSGHIVDRTVIERHLLSTPNDPFSRAPLTVNELIPQPELRAKIKNWIAEVQKSKR